MSAGRPTGIAADGVRADGREPGESRPAADGVPSAATRHSATLTVRDFSIRFLSADREVRAVDAISCDISDGHINAIVGPSGCGKSTLLNAVADLLPPTAQLSGELAVRPGVKLGYVFQQDALLPWRTTLGNAEMGLEIAGIPRSERLQRLEKWLRITGLTDFADHYPHQLSGGMRQRVSLIRTLVCEPHLVLMDEPFGALDAQTRAVMQDEVLRIWRETRTTILLVTHDLAEAILLARRVFVMSRQPGRVIRVFDVELAEPRDVFETRVTPQFEALYKEVWQVLRDQFRSQAGNP